MITAIFVIAIAATIAFFIAGVVYAYEYLGWFVNNEEVVRKAEIAENKLALTFDDGPHPEYTPKILDILKAHGVKACFFLVGRHAEARPDIVRRMAEEGHDIGNHTYSHRMLAFLTEKEMQTEILRCEETVENITGKKPCFFRPPRAVFTNKVRQYAKSRGYQFVLWSASTKDWMSKEPQSIYRRAVRHAKPGGILLFHDGGGLVGSEGGNREATVAALPGILSSLKEKGFEVVPLRDLL